MTFFIHNVCLQERGLVLFVSFEFTAQILYILIKCKLNKSIRYLFCGKKR